MHYVGLVFLLMVVTIFWKIAAGTVKLLWFSTVVSAQVTEVGVTPGGRGPSYDIAVAYRFGEAEYADWLRLGPHEAEALKVGDAVRVQVLPERPDRAHLYSERYPYRLVTAVVCLFALMPSISLAKLLAELYVAPWKLRALLRRGEATTAVIVGKNKVPGRLPTHTVTYEYQVPTPPDAGRATADTVPVQASMKVPGGIFPGLQVGDVVVVLYHPERPGTSVIYRCADYEFVPTSGGQ
jgi:hypothetical protein